MHDFDQALFEFYCETQPKKSPDALFPLIDEGIERLVAEQFTSARLPERISFLRKGHKRRRHVVKAYDRYRRLVKALEVAA